MEVIRGLYNLQPRHRGCVATIGNFDGVHLGHQAVIEDLAACAREIGLPSVLITFEPQPAEYFAPASAPARLTRLREKLIALSDASIDRVLVLRFDETLASLEAQIFVQTILVEGLGIRHLIVGDDFRFGAGRAGDTDLLRRMGVEAGFSVGDVKTHVLDGERVSSTRIRSALESGDMRFAAQLLGRGYRLSGHVVHGDKRGRTIGFPTANVMLKRSVSPVRGVFAVTLYGIDGQSLPGVANIGTRPTVDGRPRILLETHLFDFDHDIYGRPVEVELNARLRDEKKFDSFDALREQIELDSAAARAFFVAS
ncbi:MAG TPA: bifunctional riboflavin kinase/FAD synthetase [Chromatiaceae bacterium]|jgi:riboflavin kinase/FMN adenylyltransferase|nr:bifunctional riboflavin kinase/FAD synthetase [Chromatiaceae bacterium]HIO14179.1 bifunctional riboflavin kinase/FAD synthetase [Chromatiales bacterium]